MKRRWTDQEKDVLRRDRAAGLPCKVTAKRLGRTAAGVRLAGQRILGPIYRHSRAAVEAAVRDNPRTPNAILAARLGCHPSSVRAARKRLGIKPPRPRFKTAARRHALRGRYDRDRAACASEGWPVGCLSGTALVLDCVERGIDRTPLIADALGLHPTTVRDKLGPAIKKAWVTRKKIGRHHYHYRLTPAVVERRGRLTPNLMVCVGCSRIAPVRAVVSLERLGWHARRPRHANAGNKKEREVSCPGCFELYGWGDLEGGAA